jgi:uncharacterized protein
MSKQETSPTQNLEEILASIRKSLDDESTKGLSKLSKPPEAPAPEARAPAEPAADGLSSRLAGALGGAATSLDGALADVFAHRPQKDPPAAAAPVTPATKPVEAKDPMWFLTRPGVADDGAKVPPAAATPATPAIKPVEAKDPAWFLARPGVADDGTADKGEGTPSRGRDITGPLGSGSVDEVKLSRPETLRPSLPPLFAADGLVPPAAAPAATPAVVKAAEARPEKAAEQAVTPTVPPERDRRDPSPKSATASQPVPAAQPTEASSAAQGPPLEEMIAQLLEPVLVRWLDTNLPRMIESVVRAEVDRALTRGK